MVSGVLFPIGLKKEDINMVNIENNTIQLKDFEIPLSQFTGTDSFILKDIQEIPVYQKDENGKNVRTDVFSHTNVTVVDPDTFCTFTIKVPKKFKLTDTDSRLRVDIDASKTFVKPYKVEYGKVRVTIFTDDINIAPYN